AQRVAAHVADRDARVLALVPNDAHDLLAPLLGHRRKRHANHAAGRDGRQPEIRVQNGLLDGRDHRLLPRLHDERARVLDVDGRGLRDRHLRAVVLDGDVIEETGVSTTGAQPPKLVLQRLDRLLHAVFRIFFYIFYIGDHELVPVIGNWLPTAVPTLWPRTSRTRSPGVLRLKTISGKSLSRHITIAVASMTRSLSDNT